MSECPFCDDYRYEPTAAPLVAKRVGDEWPPVVWDGRGLRKAYGSEPPNGRPLSLGRHICAEHPLEPDVLLLGPVRFEMI